MGDACLERLSAICLALPGTVEKDDRGDPTWHAHGRRFAFLKFGRGIDRGIDLWMAAPAGAQEALVQSDPLRFFRPSHHRVLDGWIGVHLGEPPVDWDEVEFLLAQAHETVGMKQAPKGRQRGTS